MSRRKNCLSALFLLALMVGTGFFLLRGQALSELAAAMRQVHLRYILLGLGLMLTFVGCEAMGTRLVLKHLGHCVPYRRCLGYSFTGFYFSSITPSATGGQPAQVYYMSKDGLPPALGALDMLLLTICYQIASLILGGAAFVLRPGALLEFEGLGLLLLYGSFSTLLLTAAILMVMFAPRWAEGIANQVLHLLERLRLLRQAQSARSKLELQLAEYRRGAACLRTCPSLLPALLALSLLQLLALYLVPFAVYCAFGLTGHTAIELACVQALLTLAVSTLPLPGAVGPSEGGFLKAFTPFFGSSLVTPAMLVSRGISFYAFLLISGVVTLSIHLWVHRQAKPLPKSPRQSSPSLHADRRTV